MSGVILATLITILLGAIMLLIGCSSVTGPDPATNEIDCNNYFNQCPVNVEFPEEWRQA